VHSHTTQNSMFQTQKVIYDDTNKVMMKTAILSRVVISPHRSSLLDAGCCYRCLDLQGAPIKNNPLGKIHYVGYCNSFFVNRFTAFTEDDLRHIRSKFRHNICYGLKLLQLFELKSTVY